MIQKFATKRDTYGNRYALTIDHEAKTYSRDYNPWRFDEYITIKKSDRTRMIAELSQAGYKSV